jgi:hypothetical protein
MKSGQALAHVRKSERYKALGRLKSGTKNKAEIRYEEEVLKPSMMAGNILWYAFEGIKLKLADRTFITIDYAVLPKSGVMELHDVKGHRAIYLDDAKVKMKVAADKFPFVFKVAFMPRGGRPWEVEEV